MPSARWRSRAIARHGHLVTRRDGGGSPQTKVRVRHVPDGLRLHIGDRIGPVTESGDHRDHWRRDREEGLPPISGAHPSAGRREERRPSNLDLGYVAVVDVKRLTTTGWNEVEPVRPDRDLPGDAPVDRAGRGKDEPRSAAAGPPRVEPWVEPSEANKSQQGQDGDHQCRDGAETSHTNGQAAKTGDGCPDPARRALASPAGAEDAHAASFHGRASRRAGTAHAVGPLLPSKHVSHPGWTHVGDIHGQGDGFALRSALLAGWLADHGLGMEDLDLASDVLFDLVYPGPGRGDCWQRVWVRDGVLPARPRDGRQPD